MFSLVGLTLLFASMRYVYDGKITEASATFGLSFFSFFYSNLARFRKFKGLGFEAELWEDKQKEAEELIERLKNIVSVYTRETVLSRVRQGRLGSGGGWRERWNLYDELVNQHNVLGQRIDFSDLKKKVDHYFVFDMAHVQSREIISEISDAKRKAREKMNRKFGSPIQDVAGFSKETAELNKIQDSVAESFKYAASFDLAGKYLDIAEKAKFLLREGFGVEINYNEARLANLKTISDAYNSGPIVVSDKFMEMAEEKNSL